VVGVESVFLRVVSGFSCRLIPKPVIVAPLAAWPRNAGGVIGLAKITVPVNLVKNVGVSRADVIGNDVTNDKNMGTKMPQLTCRWPARASAQLRRKKIFSCGRATGRVVTCWWS